MGSTNFFAKLASVDPLAQALNLPGAHKYAQAQAQDVQTNPGPFAGQTPTLAASKAGYTPGTPGAQVGWTPNQATTPGNAIFSKLQGAANLSGNATPQPWASGTLKPFTQANPSAGTGNSFVQQSGTVNPYVTAAQRSTVQPTNQTWGG
jgi:hypothetical protein